MAAKTIALHGAAGRQGRWCHAAEPHARVAGAHEAKPAGGGCEPGRAARPHPVPVQPEGTVDLEVGEVAARERARRRKTAGTPEFNGRGPVQAHPGDLLRRHGHHGRQGRRRVEQLFPCCVPTDESRARRSDASAGGTAVGRCQELRRLRHVGAGQVHAVHRRGHADPGHVQRVAARRCPATRASRTRRPAALALTSVRTVVAGDSLASIAYREYGDPTMWRPLAAFNGIDDPLRLRLGASLLLPVVDDLAGRGVTWPRRRSATPSRSRSTGLRCRPTSSRCSCRRTSTTASTCRTW